MAQTEKDLPAVRKTWVRSMGQEDALEEDMAPHSSILAWKIPGTEKPGGLLSMASHRVTLKRLSTSSIPQTGIPMGG